MNFFYKKSCQRYASSFLLIIIFFIYSFVFSNQHYPNLSYNYQ